LRHAPAIALYRTFPSDGDQQQTLSSICALPEINHHADAGASNHEKGDSQ